MKYKYTKKNLLDICYYDEIYKNDKIKMKLFKRYSKGKEYSVKKFVDRQIYPNQGVVFKINRVYIDLKDRSFKMQNHIFGVLNLYSFYKSLLKVVPSFNKLFEYTKKDIVSKKSKRRITLNHVIHAIDEKTNQTFQLGTNLKQYTNLKDFFNDYERFFREYTLNHGYHFQIRTIEVIIKFYYHGKKNK